MDPNGEPPPAGTHARVCGFNQPKSGCARERVVTLGCPTADRAARASSANLHKWTQDASREERVTYATGDIYATDVERETT